MDDLSFLLRARPRRTWLPLLVSALLMALTVWLGWWAYREHEEARLNMLRIERMRAAHALPPPTLTSAEQEAQKRWLALTAERAFSWSPIFTAVERAASPEIELLEFRPAKEQRSISLQGEARSRESLTAFLDALSRQPILRNVHLIHQVKLRHDRLETVQFEINAAIGE